MKKRKLSDIQNFLFIIIAGLCLLLLNMRSVSEISRLVIAGIIILSYTVSLIIECISFKNIFSSLNAVQKFNYGFKIILLIFILIGFVLIFYASNKSCFI